MSTKLSDCLDHCIHRALVLAALGHHWHLLTKSYAQHLAFGEFYGYMHDVADKLSETAMGANFPQPCNCKESVEFTDPSAAIPVMEKYIKDLEALNVAAAAAKRDWLANIAQEIQAGVLSTLYKLKRLS